MGYRPWSCKSDTTEVTQHMKLKTKNLSVILVVATFYSLIAQTVKNLPAMREAWVPSLGREDPPGGGHSNPLQYSCLENPMDRGAWWATGHGVASQTQLK